MITQTDVSTHRKVIQAIHNNWLQGNPFALREVADKAAVSHSSTVRTLNVLKKIKMLKFSRQAYAARHYSITTMWPKEVKEIIDIFEFARILKV